MPLPIKMVIQCSIEYSIHSKLLLQQYFFKIFASIANERITKHEYTYHTQISNKCYVNINWPARIFLQRTYLRRKGLMKIIRSKPNSRAPEHTKYRIKVFSSARTSDGLLPDLRTLVLCELGSNSTEVLPSSVFAARTAPYLSQLAPLLAVKAEVGAVLTQIQFNTRWITSLKITEKI